MGIFRVKTQFQKQNNTIKIIAGRMGAKKAAVIDVPETQPYKIIDALGGMSNAKTDEQAIKLDAYPRS